MKQLFNDNTSKPTNLMNLIIHTLFFCFIIVGRHLDAHRRENILEEAKVALLVRLNMFSPIIFLNLKLVLYSARLFEGKTAYVY